MTSLSLLTLSLLLGSSVASAEAPPVTETWKKYCEDVSAIYRTRILTPSFQPATQALEALLAESPAADVANHAAWLALGEREDAIRAALAKNLVAQKQIIDTKATDPDWKVKFDAAVAEETKLNGELAPLVDERAKKSALAEKLKKTDVYKFSAPDTGKTYSFKVLLGRGGKLAHLANSTKDYSPIMFVFYANVAQGYPADLGELVLGFDPAQPDQYRIYGTDGFSFGAFYGVKDFYVNVALKSKSLPGACHSVLEPQNWKTLSRAKP